MIKVAFFVSKISNRILSSLIYRRKRMGVQNFWQLIESTGRPVNMNKGLEGKILAIGKILSSNSLD